MTELGRETHQTRPVEFGGGPGNLRAAQDITPEDIERRFTYHRPEGQKIEDHEDVRRGFKVFANTLRKTLPAGREKSLAITALEESSMWAHAAIAREGK